MCKISDKLKLCTCKAKDIYKLKHYWKLKKLNGSELIIVGEMILPVQIGEQAERYNITTLTKLLNAGTCFDVAPILQENDVLYLHFTFKADRD